MWRLRNPSDPERDLELQPYQLDFALSPKRNTLFSAGWNSGKTIAGIGFCVASSWACGPGSIGIVVLPTFVMVDEWIETVAEPILGGIIQKRIRAPSRILYLPGGRKWYFRSATHPQQIQMTNAAWGYADEPHLMPELVWSHLSARVGRNEKDISPRIGLTSLPKIGWLSEQFLNREHPDYRIMYGRTADNAYANEDYIDSLIAACPKRMLPAYLEGRFVHAGAVVYPQFSERAHVIRWRPAPSVSVGSVSSIRSEFSLAIDPGPRRPHVLWLQRIPAGVQLPNGVITQRPTSIVIDEIYPGDDYRGCNNRRLCDLIRSRRPDLYPLITSAVIDPASMQRHQLSAAQDDTTKKMLERYLDIPVYSLTGQLIKIGIQHVELGLEPASGHPYLYFSESLLDHRDSEYTPAGQHSRGIIKSMGGYCYGVDKAGHVTSDPIHDDWHSHSVDSLRYYMRYYHAEHKLSVERWSVR